MQTESRFQRFSMLSNRLMQLNLVTRKSESESKHPYLRGTSSSPLTSAGSEGDQSKPIKGGSRSPVEVLRVTKEGLVKQRIQQFDSSPPDAASAPVVEHSPRRRQTAGEVELRRKISHSFSLPKHSRPISCYESSAHSRLVSKIGSAQDLRHVSTLNPSTRRCSASPDYSRMSTGSPPPATDVPKPASPRESTAHRIRAAALSDQDKNCSHNSLPRTAPTHRDLEATKSLPILTKTPSPIIVKVRKPSKGSDSSDRTQNSSVSSDKTAHHHLSPSPDSSDFTTRLISSPPLRRRPLLDTNTFDSKSPPHSSAGQSRPPASDPAHRTAPYKTAAAEDSSNDDVFGSPDHTCRICPPSPCEPALSTGSEEGREPGTGDTPAKSPARKPSLLRRKQGVGNAERKKRTVTFTPEVLLLQLCFEGRLKDIEKLLEEPETDADCINALGPMGITAMHQCALDGNVGCLQALVNAGGNVDVVDAENCTPLHSAAINNHFSAIRFLLMAGADPSREDDDSKTAHDIATDERVRKVLKMALQGGFSPSSSTPQDSKEKGAGGAEDSQRAELPSATTRDTESNKGVSTIISHKRGSNWEDKPVQNREFMGIKMTNQKKEGAQNTAANSEDDVSFTSSYSGHSGELSGLSGLNSSCGNSDDSPCKSPMAFSTTALHSSTNNSSIGTDILDRDNLTAYDVDSDLEPESEDFKFQEAVSNQDVPAVTRILRDSRDGIDINRITRLGITALHHSVLEENFLLTQKLVSEGRVDVNIRDRDGWTPLHAASAVGNLKIAKFLVESGARTSLWNSSGEFAVDVAEDDAMKRYLHSIMLGPHAVKKRFPSMLS